MTLSYIAPPRGGRVAAIPSKSVAHRMLILAAFADRPTCILCPASSADIDATVHCLTALGARIDRTKDGFLVSPAATLPAGICTLDCGESGSTLRFLLPVAAARTAGAEARFRRHGRLPKRPLSPLYEELIRHGVQLPDSPEEEPLSVRGPMTAGDYTLAADVSSQFISGLLMAFPLLAGESTLHLTGRIESEDYIRITLDVLRRFGVYPAVSADRRTYRIRPGRFQSPGTLDVEGDWSNAAMWLAAGAVGHHPIAVTGLDPASVQGDRRILDVLRAFGADVRVSAGEIAVYPSALHGITLDAAQIPDLVPVIAAVAAAAEGESVIDGIARLRLKESDRAAAVTALLGTLGADIVCEADRLVIRGGRRLHGATVTSAHDHRMVMCAFVASLITDGTVRVTDARAIEKSYPGFPDDLAALGGSFLWEDA